jgi:hypothetical protein
MKLHDLEFGETKIIQGLYTITDEMRRNIAEEGAVGSVEMPIWVFLFLTTRQYGKIPTNKKPILPFEEYEDLAEEGEIKKPPYLKYLPNGHIMSHEGRHRSSALELAGHETTEIFLIPVDGEKNPLQKKLLPDKLVGQFNPEVEIKIDYSSFKSLA